MRSPNGQASCLTRGVLDAYPGCRHRSRLCPRRLGLCMSLHWPMVGDTHLLYLGHHRSHRFCPSPGNGGGSHSFEARRWCWSWCLLHWGCQDRRATPLYRRRTCPEACLGQCYLWRAHTILYLRRSGGYGGQDNQYVSRTIQYLYIC